ncbi:hypothetical protein QAD02_013840 [Eretmocerus hayati]|uniref:Uncharacterized protein n=1 Tax=Eretmocerus hayati TaxID=131215 RepID=A0ACC2P3K7_9HYME|nr:hypothetical protein QAD02_013840 [Eretmocerus hayati]
MKKRDELKSTPLLQVAADIKLGLKWEVALNQKFCDNEAVCKDRCQNADVMEEDIIHFLPDGRRKVIPRERHKLVENAVPSIVDIKRRSFADDGDSLSILEESTRDLDQFSKEPAERNENAQGHALASDDCHTPLDKDQSSSGDFLSILDECTTDSDEYFHKPRGCVSTESNEKHILLRSESTQSTRDPVSDDDVLAIDELIDERICPTLCSIK